MDEATAPQSDWTMAAWHNEESITLSAENGERWCKVELLRPVSRSELAEGLRFLASKL